MASPAAHPADQPPSRLEARQGVLTGLLGFGVRLARALRQKAAAIVAAGQDAPDLSVPLARVSQLISNIFAFSARLGGNAAERPQAVEPAARPEGERLGEYEDLFEDLREFEYELEDEFDDNDLFDDLFADLREKRLEKPRDPWADLPFDEAVAQFWEEFQDIASALGDHPLVREAQAAAAKALCPSPDGSPPPAADEPDPPGLRPQLAAPTPPPPDSRDLRFLDPIRRRIGGFK